MCAFWYAGIVYGTVYKAHILVTQMFTYNTGFYGTGEQLSTKNIH